MNFQKQTTKKLSSIIFKEVTKDHKIMIMNWLNQPHVQEFWDNSPEHREDIDHFINGRPGASNYFDGLMSYWIGLIEEEPFCLVMTSTLSPEEELPKIYIEALSKTGTTTTIDFCIGSVAHLGKGLAAPTLKKFMEFYAHEIAPSTDLFFIDPNENNPRAKHVYGKAGFKEVAKFQMEDGYFQGQWSYLMTCKVNAGN